MLPRCDVSIMLQISIRSTCNYCNTSYYFSNFRESLFNVLSAVYALLLVVMGAVFPIAEVFADPVSPGGFEVRNVHS